jgi:hypothetical protein
MRMARNKWCLLAAALVAVAIGAPQVHGAATTLYLTTVGSSGYIGDAYFEWVDEGSTGTGVIDSFVRMGTNASIEQGYNTDGPLEFDTKASTHTHSLLLSSVPIVQIDGVDYREFLLDIGEPGSASLLSLDTIEIYLADSGSLTGYPTFGGSATKVYDLDLNAGGDSWIILDSNLNSGNGWGDMFAYIPNSVFTGGDYVYLYSRFGEHEAQSGSFEEWAVRLGVAPPPPPPIPAPAASLLVLIGSSIAVSWHRRRTR